MNGRRTLLTLLTDGVGRSRRTCQMRCGDQCSHPVPNESDNDYIGDIITSAISRRTLLQASVVVGGAAALGVGANAFVKAPPASAISFPGSPAGMGWTPIAPSTADAVIVPQGFDQDVVIRWGDPIFPKTPAFDPNNQTAAAQQRQWGYNNDYLGFLPTEDPNVLLMLANHEYTDEYIMFPRYNPAAPTREQVEIAWAAHGLSVVAVRKVAGTGNLEPILEHRLNRRFHTQTRFELTGPVAGHELVRTSADQSGRSVLGTLNNCSGGLTPWGTWLTAEENFNQYFGNAAAVTEPVAAARLKRYGISGAASERKWERFDNRFDLAEEPNEANRFGWIVEVDPFDPQSTPKKRTALGRFKHEAANIAVAKDGRVAAYMGDDERFDYFYKFVSANKMVAASRAAGSRAATARANSDLLDNGTLYVAKFTGNSGAMDGTGKLPADGRFDGTGEWIKLASGTQSFVEGMSAEEVYLFTRQAADKMGATKMDRPEDAEPSPRTGKVYIALTNNTDRGKAGKAGADEANPRNLNKHGHVLELIEDGNDSAATTFTWNLFLVAGDPNDPTTYFGGFDKAQVSPISCPDNVAFDEHGNLWIATDGSQLGAHDGMFAAVAEGASRGQLKQFLSVPKGAECCGPWVDAERVAAAIQHPGETDGASFEAPSSHWPDGGTSVPRPSIVVAWPRAAATPPPVTPTPGQPAPGQPAPGQPAPGQPTPPKESTGGLAKTGR
ncbi:phosphatase [Enemella dayhoffiae]|uniref:Phosphatase n=1 Tax=Enemella dayhoffiae TaxID=2016507 RepID=A0A255H352_9ACTN|nr:PhoX family phosphatase [Enemella dayhoffiae]OYO22070.1 phosphatase [Enemella dayhoffiae]